MKPPHHAHEARATCPPPPSANLLRALRVSAFRFLPLLLLIAVAACTHSVTRDQVMTTAQAYTQVRWMPEARHICHGKDGLGQWVHTPDNTLVKHTGDPNGWWQPGTEAIGMPYMWGGFDTPQSFQKKLTRGHFAGDIATPEKVRLLERAVSRRATGVDCSGFISRCWGLRRAHSTRTLHRVSQRLSSWNQLEPGDMLLTRGHVMLFAGWAESGSSLDVYEAAPIPHWKVSRNTYTMETLLKSHYAPWRFNHIR